MRAFYRLLAAAGLSVAAQSATAAVIFSDNFNNFAPGSYDVNAQADTGLTISAFGEVPGWIKGGINAVHAEDRSGGGDWAPMFYGASGYDAGNQNSLLMASGVAANALGTTYTVAFEGAAAAYAQSSQGNQDGDYVRFRVLDAANSVISTFIYDPANWSFGPANPFTAATFDYTGTGTGSVRLLIDAFTTYDHFGGSIDNLSISGNAPVPEPAAIGLLGLGLAGVAARRRRR